jgi:hypothetical protein
MYIWPWNLLFFVGLLLLLLLLLLLILLLFCCCFVIVLYQKHWTSSTSAAINSLLIELCLFKKKFKEILSEIFGFSKITFEGFQWLCLYFAGKYASIWWLFSLQSTRYCKSCAPFQQNFCEIIGSNRVTLKRFHSCFV